MAHSWPCEFLHAAIYAAAKIHNNKCIIKLPGILALLYLVPYSKKHWQWNNSEFGELQHFAKFFAYFHNFHNIPYAKGFQFAKVFSAKLPTVLIHQSFLLPKFFAVWYPGNHKIWLWAKLPINNFLYKIFSYWNGCTNILHIKITQITDYSIKLHTIYYS